MDENNIMKPEPHCQKIDIDGVIANGKQFDLAITLPDVNKKKYQLIHVFCLHIACTSKPPKSTS